MIRILRDRDKDHLGLLVMFHYILGALDFLAGCSPIFHLSFGIAIMAGVFDNDPNPPPPVLGWLFTIIGGGVMITFWLLAILHFVAARCLATRSHYYLCYGIACIECIKVPQGTILGIFTILVLMRPSVKALFLDTPAPEPSADDDREDDFDEPTVKDGPAMEPDR
jgi:hypothetical protein